MHPLGNKRRSYPSDAEAGNLYNHYMKRLAFLFLFLGLCLGLQAKTRVEIAEENSPAIVAVNVLKKDGSTFTGTGFVVSEDGVIATSGHVIQDALYMNITFNTGAVSGQAMPLAAAEKVDLALLKIGARNLPAVTLGDSDYILPGQEITVIGNPRRLQNTVTSGLISQVRRKADGTILHQISAPISPSSSGSPVFDEDGRVVSVAFGSYKGEGNQNLNFSVPSNYLVELLHQNHYYPPVMAPQEGGGPQDTWKRITAHLSKSWEMTKRLFARLLK